MLNISQMAKDTALFHDLLLSRISAHSVCSEITSHNPLHWTATKCEHVYCTVRRLMLALVQGSWQCTLITLVYTTLDWYKQLIVTIKCQYETVLKLLSGTSLNDLKLPVTWISRSWYYSV